MTRIERPRKGTLCEEMKFVIIALSAALVTILLRISLKKRIPLFFSHVSRVMFCFTLAEHKYLLAELAVAYYDGVSDGMIY